MPLFCSLDNIGYYVFPHVSESRRMIWCFVIFHCCIDIFHMLIAHYEHFSVGMIIYFILMCSSILRILPKYFPNLFSISSFILLILVFGDFKIIQ